MKIVKQRTSGFKIFKRIDGRRGYIEKLKSVIKIKGNVDMTYQDITGFETHDISANDDYDLPRTALGSILNPIERGDETTDTESGATIEATESGTGN